MIKKKKVKRYKNKSKPSVVRDFDEKYFLHPPEHLSKNRQEVFLSIKQASEWASDYLKKEVKY